jgi:hypothetical protein
VGPREEEEEEEEEESLIYSSCYICYKGCK